MKLSLNWIKTFLKNNITLNAEQLQNLVSTKVAELEGFEDQSQQFHNIVIGKITQLDKHPDADKLTICQVDIGTPEHIQIVCGGTNLRLNMLTVVALPDSQVRWHGEGELITLKATKLRGQYSHGMICTSDEIGLGKPQDESHIMDLSHLENITIGQNLNQALHLNDVILEIDNKSITNRPDLWGHIGFAREISAITNNNLQIPSFDIPPIKKTDYSINILDNNICRRFTSIKISNLIDHNQTKAEQIQKDLEKLGHKSVNPIVDAINHTMLEYGQPMHAYDLQKLISINSNSDKLDLNIKFNNTHQDFLGIDNQTHKLTENIPVLEVNNTPVCILGIMGGKNTEVDSNTTEILIESANFIDSTVRKASQTLSLRSESSQRFEKCLDPNLTTLALSKAIHLLQEIYPQAKVSNATQDIYPIPQETLQLEISAQEINNYLGTQISDKQIQEILEKLDFQVSPAQNSDSKLIITVPTFRATKDITIKQDIIEEVGRIYGYDQIPTSLPNQSNQLPTPNKSKNLENNIRTLLEGLNFHETINYSFYSHKDINNTLLDNNHHILLKNYLSEEQTHMRTSLLPGLCKNILHNYKNFPEAYLYEIGRTYTPTQEFFPAEEEKLGLLYYTNQQDLNQFFNLKSQIQTLLQKLNIKHQIIKSNQPENYSHPNISAEIIDQNKNQIGQICLLNPVIAENYNIKNTNIFYAEINLGLLIHEKTITKTFQELPKFPDMEFDISVVVDHKTTHHEIIKTLKTTSNLIHDIQLFDIFEDESKLGANKKAMGYKITLRSLERTLTDEDLTQVQQKSYKNLQQIGGIIRGS